MRERLGGVDQYENEGAGAGDTNNLFAASFSVLGSFDDSWQVQQLDLRSFILNNSWDAGKSGKLVGGDFGINTCQLHTSIANCILPWLEE